MLELGFKFFSNVFTSPIKWLLCSQMTEGDVWMCLIMCRGCGNTVMVYLH